MTHKQFFAVLLSTSLVVAVACNSGEDASKDASTTNTEAIDNGATTAEGTNPKGIGPHQNVQLTSPLDPKMIASGKSIYEVKCQSCHKLSDERLVGPGWKGVTDRRTPEWIMNFTTNTEEMLEKDTAVQNMLEVCLVKMPNQGVPEADARSIVEFMRQNDGKK
jgi:cytochrome c2